MKGIYVLIISVDSDISVNTGALGSLSFAKGLYAYVGSAQNNLEKRVERHLSREKKRFWHVDYLLNNPGVRVLKVLRRNAARAEECRIAEELGRQGFPIKSFGCSDCKCQSHLFLIENYESLKGFTTETTVGRA